MKFISLGHCEGKIKKLVFKPDDLGFPSLF